MVSRLYWWSSVGIGWSSVVLVGVVLVLVGVGCVGWVVLVWLE